MIHDVPIQLEFPYRMLRLNFGSCRCCFPPVVWRDLEFNIWPPQRQSVMGSGAIAKGFWVCMRHHMASCFIMPFRAYRPMEFLWILWVTWCCTGLFCICPVVTLLIHKPAENHVNQALNRDLLDNKNLQSWRLAVLVFPPFRVGFSSWSLVKWAVVDPLKGWWT